MTIDFQSSRLIQEGRGEGGGEEENGEGTCCTDCNFGPKSKNVRIATWAHAAPTLEAYADFYSKVHPEASPIRFSAFPSLRELQMEALLDVRLGSKLYDGFVIPPMLVGDLYEYQGLAPMNVSSQELNDLLPYYRDYVSMFDGDIRTMPLVAGNQMLLLFRKDYLDSKGLAPPKTWGDFLNTAASLHNEPLKADGGVIYGACLGRMSEEACSDRRDQTGEDCRSLSMTYLGSTMASMTQTMGSSTGWLFDDDTSKGMQSLLGSTLESTLVFMEEAMKYGAPDEMESDESLNLRLFEQGLCAMTLSADHPFELLQDEKVGFAPIPGSDKVLDRESQRLVQCDSDLCPYGNNYDPSGRVNMVPFGAHDILVGGVSATASESNQASVDRFMRFMRNTRLRYIREQSLTYTGLQASTIPGYEDLMEELTAHGNVAIPLRIPNAYQMLSDADTKVYDYLLAGNYTEANRQHLLERVEYSWQRIIERHDDRVYAVPTATFYEKSLGTFTPEPASDLYIGGALRSVGWTMGCICVFTSISMAFWVWRNTEERVIRASQRLFLWMICAGTLVMGSTIFLIGLEDDIAPTFVVSASCMTSVWLYSFGFVLTYSALFSKMWRINKIFRDAHTLHRIKVEPMDMIVPFFFLFGSNFVVLLVWTITSPVRWTREPIDDPGTALNLVETSTYGKCDSKHYTAYLGIIVGINTLSSLIMLIQAYECRKISTDFSESIWISGAMLCIVQVWIIGIPVIKLVAGSPKLVFLVETGVVFVSCMSTLLLLFLPKMRYLRQSRQSQLENKNATNDFRLERRDSITSHASEDTYEGVHNEDPSTKIAANVEKISSGLEGIRIIQSSKLRHSDEVERLRKNLEMAEARNKVLQNRLERLHDKMEQYIIARQPNGPAGVDGSFIIHARVGATTKIGSQSH